MNRLINFRTITLSILLFLSVESIAQTSTSGESNYNPITTAVPFLTITPDSRHGAMGDAGVATSPDANAQYWNQSKFAFIDEQFGVSLSFTPWLKTMFNDMNLAYLSGYMKLNSDQAIGASLRYFSVGEILLNDQNGTSLATIRPNEYALDFSYSRKLSAYFSGGVALRYIRSDLSGGIGSQMYVPGNAFATDVSFYYRRSNNDIVNNKTFAAGINISNVGSRLSYDNGSNKEYLPANLKLGATFTDEFNQINSFAFSLDFNKLLVPTPSPGTSIGDKPVVTSIFSSLTDAPGGFKEEMQEINYSLGFEYWYSHKFAARCGYFNENAYKGNRKFFSTGFGVKMNICSVDVSYLIPINQNNPLANTIRFSLLFDLSRLQKKGKTVVPEEQVAPSAPANQPAPSK